MALLTKPTASHSSAYAERAVHLALGLSVLSWGPLSLLEAAPADRTSPVRLTLFVIHIVVGVLFATRRPLQRPPVPGDILWAVPSLAAAGLAFKFGPAPHAWPPAAAAVFAVFGALSLVALVTLGRSFSLLPTPRTLVTRGPYRLVRHPAYAAELVMVGAACAALYTVRPWFWATALFVLGTAGFVVRIREEERLLQADAAWTAYAERVRYRLIPFLY